MTRAWFMAMEAMKEKIMSPQATGRYIRIVGSFSILVAILFALAGVNDFTGANEIFFQLASSGGNGVAGLDTPEAKMAMAIAGGVFAGLMAMYVFISAPGVEQGSELIRKGTISGVVRGRQQRIGSIRKCRQCDAQYCVSDCLSYAVIAGETDRLKRLAPAVHILDPRAKG